MPSQAESRALEAGGWERQRRPRSPDPPPCREPLVMVGEVGTPTSPALGGSEWVGGSRSLSWPIRLFSQTGKGRWAEGEKPEWSEGPADLGSWALMWCPHRVRTRDPPCRTPLPCPFPIPQLAPGGWGGSSGSRAAEGWRPIASHRAQSERGRTSRAHRAPGRQGPSVCSLIRRRALWGPPS